MPAGDLPVGEIDGGCGARDVVDFLSHAIGVGAGAPTVGIVVAAAVVASEAGGVDGLEGGVGPAFKAFAAILSFAGGGGGSPGEVDGVLGHAVGNLSLFNEGLVGGGKGLEGGEIVLDTAGGCGGSAAYETEGKEGEQEEVFHSFIDEDYHQSIRRLGGIKRIMKENFVLRTNLPCQVESDLARICASHCQYHV